MHWPVAFLHGNGNLFPTDPETGLIQVTDVPVADTWAAMEALVAKGKARSIGISNFTKEKTEALLKTAKIKPVVNQIEAHPYLQQVELLNYSKKEASSSGTKRGG
jgi:L-glyceraldehyde reductase